MPVRDLVFICYSRADNALVDFRAIFAQQLQAAANVRGADLKFSDVDIEVGADWRAAIRAAIGRTRVALLLEGPGLFASEFVTSEEIPAFLAAQADGLVVFRVPIRNVSPAVVPAALEAIQAAHPVTEPLFGLEPAALERVIAGLVTRLFEVYDRARPSSAPAPGPLEDYLRALEDERKYLKVQPRGDDAALRVDEVFVELTCARSEQAWAISEARSERAATIVPEVEVVLERVLPYDREAAAPLREALRQDGYTEYDWRQITRLLAEWAGDEAQVRSWFETYMPHRAEALAQLARRPAKPDSTELHAALAAALAALEVPHEPGDAHRMARLANRVCALRHPDAAAIGEVLETIELTDLMAAAPRVVIVGDPGSGKSTLLQQALLRAVAAARSAPGSAPIPVWVELSELGAALVASSDQSRAGDDLRCLEALIDGRSEVVRVDRLIVFFDGLDEVTDRTLRDRCTRAIGQLMAKWKGARCVVASRPLGEGEDVTLRPLRDEGFVGARVLKLSWAKIREIVEAYLPRLGASPAALLERLESDAQLLDLGSAPVRLAMLCGVFASDPQGGLPAGRAALYERCTAHFLGTEVARILPRNVDAKDLEGDFLAPWALELFAKAQAHRALSMAEEDFEDEVGRRLELDRTSCRATAEALTRRGGLLVRRGRRVAPAHRTFGEYWAAREAAGKPETLKARFDDPLWREVIRLIPTAGLHHRFEHGEGLEALDARLLELERCAAQPRAGPPEGLGSLAHGLLELRVCGLDGAAFRDRVAQFFGPLVAWLEDPAQPGGESDRRAAAELLGWAGDPRLEDPWVEVPPGRFWRGAVEGDVEADHDERDGGWCESKERFWIRRWPVSVGELSDFVEVGYSERGWWSERGWAERERLGWRAPYLWAEQARRAPNTAAVGVSWWEAEAFIRWAEGTGALSKPEDDTELRLPCEAEWEMAVRWDERTVYPWPGPWDAKRLNAEGRLGGPTPVGLFPAGHSARGLWDAAGNVWEWCLDWYDPKAYRRPEVVVLDEASVEPELTYETDGEGRDRQVRSRCRVLRGGGWNNVARWCRVSFRNRFGPSYRVDSIGFRLVCCRLPPGPSSFRL